jgi:hypothetical protein
MAGSGELNGIWRAYPVIGSYLCCLLGQICRQPDHPQPFSAEQNSAIVPCQFLVSVSQGMNQDFQQGYDRSYDRKLATVKSLEERSNHVNVGWAFFNVEM